MHISQLYSPDQLRSMSISELEALAANIRSFLIRTVSQNGGHLSSNLGDVELTMAMHIVFHSPRDKFIFDVGHQCYTHKILTGRSAGFKTLRQLDGLSGYQKRSESVHDPWEAGHSSTSISAGLGMAAARDLLKQDHEIVCVIGDGAIGGGMALEALNDLGAQQRKMIVIFNDNNMSISRNSTGMEKSITRLRTSDLYRNAKQELSSSLQSSVVGKEILHFLRDSRDYLKHQMIDAPLFSQFNLDYIGPVDGHSIPDLLRAFQTAKEHTKPVVVHVITKKGKGYPFAQQDTTGLWHGVSPFNIQTGKPLSGLPEGFVSWSQCVSDALCEMALTDPNIVAITPAMANGSKLLRFASRFPDRFFDCGIAEEHGMTMAAGMAAGGIRPFISVYSSFLQRAYDQILHDVCRMDLPVVIGIDRAGLVGDDGDTHQGIYDISFLRTIPNLIIAQPKDASEARNLLYTGFQCKKPFAFRYPRGNVLDMKKEPFEAIAIGSWQAFQLGSEPSHIIITYGPDVDRILLRAKEEGKSLIVVNARFFKPLDEHLLEILADRNLPMIVYETDSIQGGLHEAILSAYNKKNRSVHLDVLGFEEAYVPHGEVELLKKKYHISLDDLFERLEHNETGSISE